MTGDPTKSAEAERLSHEPVAQNLRGWALWASDQQSELANVEVRMNEAADRIDTLTAIVRWLHRDPEPDPLTLRMARSELGESATRLFCRIVGGAVAGSGGSTEPTDDDDG